MNVSPVLITVAGLPLGGMGPGAGSLSILAVIPPAAAGANIKMQAFVIDAGSPIGASATNGLAVSIP